VGGVQQRLDVGPAPGTSSLTVLIRPERGKALWVVAGNVQAPSVSIPPSELMRTSYGQMIYQPRSERVTLHGLPPGRYTVVWANFHSETPGGPMVRTVDVPGSAELSLLQ
jgi:hypothetical protein